MGFTKDREIYPDRDILLKIDDGAKAGMFIRYTGIHTRPAIYAKTYRTKLEWRCEHVSIHISDPEKKGYARLPRKGTRGLGVFMPVADYMIHVEKGRVEKERCRKTPVCVSINEDIMPYLEARSKYEGCSVARMIVILAEKSIAMERAGVSPSAPPVTT